MPYGTFVVGLDKQDSMEKVMKHLFGMVIIHTLTH